MSDREKCRFCDSGTVELPNGSCIGSIGSEPLQGPGRTVIRSFVLQVSLLLLLMIASTVVFAENVRGGIVLQNYYGYRSPLPNIPVTVWSNRYGQRSPPVYTGLDGMYYIYNIPPGQYVLELWVYPNRGPFTQAITIFRGQYMTNLPPYVVWQ